MRSPQQLVLFDTIAPNKTQMVLRDNVVTTHCFHL